MNFFRHVHITSEKSYSLNKDISKQVEVLADFEIKRLEVMQFDMNLAKFCEYLTEAVLPLFTGYLERKNF